ncbi:MAG: aspartate--ammonia ligase [Spirochaetales bacterium]|jgi:aspartate--ammonia ligase|nr:aspartate--ammonia ligase [Spirochaetales bacterium]
MNQDIIIPTNYKPGLDLFETEKAIRAIKTFFEDNLAESLNLRRVTAPLFVQKGTGINDDLNGSEAPVAFRTTGNMDYEVEIVQSLAKWKRMALADYGFGFNHGEGLYTDMNALRPSENVGNLHSIYVDQWDWERVVSSEERSISFLKTIVDRIYLVMRRTERFIYDKYLTIKPTLPETITYLHTEELAEKYPDLSPPEREFKATEEYGAVFIIGIGAPLPTGEPHDGRAPDYDDWISPGDDGRPGLNGDIVVWNPVLNRHFELSSMGIRVSPESMVKQLAIRGVPDRKELWWHKRLLANEFPLSIGGGIGQSRLCMFFLRKAHIGEVQSSVWPESMRKECENAGIVLL